MFTQVCVIFQQIDIESYGEKTKQECIIIKIFGKDENGIPVVCSISDYQPYFYIKNLYTGDALDSFQNELSVN